MSIPLRDGQQAERVLQGMLRTAPKEVDGPPKPRTTFCKTPLGAYTLYVLPRNTLFTQLTGITESAFIHLRLLLRGKTGSGPGCGKPYRISPSSG